MNPVDLCHTLPSNLQTLFTLPRTFSFLDLPQTECSKTDLISEYEFIIIYLILFLDSKYKNSRCGYLMKKESPYEEAFITQRASRFTIEMLFANFTLSEKTVKVLTRNIINANIPANSYLISNILKDFNLRSLSKKALEGLNLIKQFSTQNNNSSAIYVTGILTPFQVLEMMAFGKRCIGMLRPPLSYTGEGHHKDGFFFLTHDLEHFYNFFQNESDHLAQKGFFFSLFQNFNYFESGLKRILEKLKFEPGEILIFNQKIFYALSDMNGHPIFILEYLLAIFKELPIPMDETLHFFLVNSLLPNIDNINLKKNLLSYMSLKSKGESNLEEIELRRSLAKIIERDYITMALNIPSNR